MQKTKPKQNNQPMDKIESKRKMKPLAWQVLGKPTDHQDSTETRFQGYKKLYFQLETVSNIETERTTDQLI